MEQLPVIREKLQSVKEWVEAATADACALVCTEETVKSVKEMRASLRKEFDGLDKQRKKVKAEILKPYEEFEELFKDCITVPFRKADEALVEKIDEVEGAQKAECERRCREYFEELKISHNLPFLLYEDAKLKISLTEAKRPTPLKHFDELNLFCARVATDIAGIKQMPAREEVLAEYLRCGYNLKTAIDNCRERHDAEDRAKAQAELMAEAEARQAETVAKVEAAAPAAVVMPEPEPEKEPEQTFERFTFTVLGATRSQLIKIRDFMKAEGIRYE